MYISTYLPNDELVRSNLRKMLLPATSWTSCIFIQSIRNHLALIKDVTVTGKIVNCCKISHGNNYHILLKLPWNCVWSPHWVNNSWWCCSLPGKAETMCVCSSIKQLHRRHACTVCIVCPESESSLCCGDFSFWNGQSLVEFWIFTGVLRENWWTTITLSAAKDKKYVIKTAVTPRVNEQREREGGFREPNLSEL